MSNRRGKVVFAIGAFSFGALTFLIASSYVVSRELPTWLAATIGALAFPVLPVGWHLFAERRRRARIATAKTPPKSSLTSTDRYVMRAVVVTAAVLAPMFVVGRFAVIRAVWNHGTWFWPASSETGSYAEGNGTTSQAPLLAHVPEEAELVVVFKGDGQKDGSGKQGVMAYGEKQLLLVAPKDADDNEPIEDKIAQINKDRGKLPFLALDPVVAVTMKNPALFAVAGEKWATRVATPGYGPMPSIKRELDRAPNTAAAVLAYAPKAPHAQLPVKSAAAWLLSTDDKLVVDARIEATDAAGAEKLQAQVRSLWAENKDIPAACREPVEKIVDRFKLERAGTIVTVHAEVPGQELMAVMFCALKE